MAAKDYITYITCDVGSERKTFSYGACGHSWPNSVRGVNDVNQYGRYRRAELALPEGQYFTHMSCGLSFHLAITNEGGLWYMQVQRALFASMTDENTPFTDETKEVDDRMKELKYPKNSNFNVLDQLYRYSHQRHPKSFTVHSLSKPDREELCTELLHCRYRNNS